MSTPIHEKIKLIRESERLNRRQFSDLTGLVYGSFCSYEAGDKKPGIEPIMKILPAPPLYQIHTVVYDRSGVP